jgi:CubicO group peptidase (beta-lactamase class C family)
MQAFHLLVPAIFSFTASAADALLDPATLKLIPQRMQELVDKRELSGVITLVARNNQIAELDAVGFADIDNSKPMRTDSIVQTCRATKTITGVAAMI